MIHKTTRSILSVLLAALLLVTSIPLTPAFAGDGGAVSLQSESGEGRALEPAADGTYLIYTAEDLREFAQRVNGTDGNSADPGAHAKLMNDINLNPNMEISEDGTVTGNPDQWTPIGTSIGNAYTGTFDGDGHTISGLYINNSRADYQGLFGYLSTDGGNTGTVQNLSVSGSVSGHLYVGGIAGQNGGRITDCAFSGSVSGVSTVGGVVGVNRGTVKNCYNTGTVTGSDSPVGGVVGYNGSGGSVTNCYNTGTVTGTDDYVGGVVGYNDGGRVENCYNTGSVSGGIYVGGVVGYNDGGSVTNSYNTGAVSGNRSVGGVVGLNSSSSASGTVTDCYFLQQDPEIPGICGGETTGATAVNDLTALCNALNTDTWTISENLSRPVLTSNHEDDGTKDHPYRIFTATQLETFRDLVNDEGGNPTAHAKLMNNIDLKDVCGKDAGESEEEVSWEPIGNSFSNSYSGTFDGNGKTISGLYIGTTANNQGLFGRVSGTVQNLTVSGSVNSSGDYVGGIVGNNSGTFENCAFTGSVSGDWYVGGVVGNNNGGTVTGCIFSGSGSVSVTGSYYVGGVVGKNSGSNGSVEKCHNTGSVSGSREDVGGVVGDNEGTVENCYNTGAVSGLDSGIGNRVGGVVGDNGGNVENCYNTGTVNVSGNSSAVGGVVGRNQGGSVQNCYNTGNVSGSISGGVVGYNDSGTVTDCYFLQQDPAIYGIGNTTKDDISQTAAKSLEDFHSGEVAYLLQGTQTTPVWGQSNLTEEGSWPTLIALDKNAKTVYQVTLKYDHAGAQDKTYYTDDTATPSETPSREGYTFDSWQKTAEEGNTITFTAQWTPHTYSITASPSALDFGSITEGEERPAAQEVTITNSGNQTVTLNPPTAENFEIGALSVKELKPDESASFTIQPKDKLPRGSYSEQIVVSNTNDEKATITASFTVKEPPYTGKYSYELSTSVGDHGSLTVDRYATEGDKVTIDVTPDQAYKLDELVVTANDKDVELTDNGDGTYSFTMPSADVKITVTFAKDPDWTEPEEPTTDVSDLFSDIAPDAWYKDAVQYAYDNGLMTGVSATEFAPEATTTRAMIVSILARLEGVESAEAAGFADVSDEWYATAVNWAANVGVVNGYEDGTFKPNTAITREQLAAILMNYAAYKGEDVSNRADLTSYTDQPSTWAEEAISWSVAEGLLTGVTADTLQPQGAATRAQVAAILQRFLSE